MRIFKQAAVAAVAALSIVASVEVDANAAEMQLAYEAVMHEEKSRAAPVLDDKKHVIGIAAFRGIAIFPEDELVSHRYDGWFDLNDGSGMFHGYALWTFADGSTLRAIYEGEASGEADGSAEVSMQFRDFSGTGRYESVSGDGSASGRRLEPINKGGNTYLKGTLKLSTGP
jgi:hypothetical protein